MSGRIFTSTEAFLVHDDAQALLVFAERVLAAERPTPGDVRVVAKLAEVLRSNLSTRERAVEIVEKWIARLSDGRERATRREVGSLLNVLGHVVEEDAAIQLNEEDLLVLRGKTRGRAWEATRVMAWLSLRFGLLGFPKAKRLSTDDEGEIRNACNLLRQAGEHTRERRKAKQNDRRKGLSTPKRLKTARTKK